MKVPFNRPYMTGKELHYISQAHYVGVLAGDGPFTEKCHRWIERQARCEAALLTHSCTAALEMAALILDIQPGDEIIMPAYTFVSTANAFVLRGGVPVFVDIRRDTLNLDEKLIEAAITPRTRAIVPVHYAGVGCEMDAINDIAKRHGLYVIEDAAQGVLASYRGRALGSLGDLGAYSFHETKNVISGEGGALLINRPEHTEIAEIIREKGTNRSQFFRGEVDKYTWQHMGSSYLPSELTAAFLWAQLEEAQDLTAQRLALWNSYHQALEPLEKQGRLRRPVVPAHCAHNAHMYYIVVDHLETRTALLEHLKRREIGAIFHYVPLHSAPGGRKYARVAGELPITEMASDCLLRLPLWIGMSPAHLDAVVGALTDFFAAYMPSHDQEKSQYCLLTY